MPRSLPQADDELLVAGDASVKDMEGAAVAWAAAQTGTPLVAIKVVTDIVDGEHATQDEFLEVRVRHQSVMPHHPRPDGAPGARSARRGCFRD